MLGARWVLRFDDVAPNMRWERFDLVVRRLDALGLPALIGVIPDNQDPELLRWPAREGFWDFVRERAARGWEIAVHGYQHRYESSDPGLLGPHPRSEFAGLSEAVQREKIDRALEIFRRERLEPRTFMAPGHSFDRATLEALRAAGLRWVTDGYALRPFEDRGLVFVPQMFAWPRPVPLGVFTSCFHVNEWGPAEVERFERAIAQIAPAVVPFAAVAGKPSGGRLSRLAGAGAHRGLRWLRRRRG